MLKVDRTSVGKRESNLKNLNSKATKLRKRRLRRRVVSILTAVVVFLTTYALVLPAITMDTETAVQEPGIEIAQPAPEAVVPESAPVQAEPIEAVPVATDTAVEDPTTQAVDIGTAAVGGMDSVASAVGSSSAVTEIADAATPLASPDAAAGTAGASTEGNAADRQSTVVEDSQTGTEDEKTEEEKEERKLAVSPFVYDTPEYTVTVSFGESAQIPEGAVFSWREFAAGTTEYSASRMVLNEKLTADGMTAEELETAVTAARFFELLFYDKNGVQFLPADAVDVLVEYKDAANMNEYNQVSDENLYAVTFRTDDGQPTKATLITTNAKDGSAGVEAANGFVRRLRVQNFPANDYHTNPVIGQVGVKNVAAIAANEAVIVPENVDSEKEAVTSDTDDVITGGGIGEDGDADITETGVKEEDEEEILTTQYLTVDGEAYNITLTYGPEAGIPDGAELSVSEIVQASDAYEEYVSKTENALDPAEKVVFARFFDIKIMKDGAEIQPNGAVNVKIELADTLTEEVKVVHFEHNDAQAAAETIDIPVVLDSARVEAEALENAVGFETESFSVFGVVETETVTVPFTASDGSTYEVTVSFGEDAGIPEGARLDVSEVTENDDKYNAYVTQSADAIDSRVIDLNYIKLLDIKIVDEEENEITPLTPVAVQIRLLDTEQAEESTQVVHFEGVQETPVVVDSSVQADTVSFSADGFSVYAVVNDGSDANEARATVNFYGKDTATPLATVYVKNSDTEEELEQIVFDPGTGELDASKKELFDGWVISTVNTTDGTAYTIETEGNTIEDVREYLKDLEIHEGDVVNIYAKIVRTITILYEGEDENTILGSAIVKVLGTDGPETTSEYTISMNYTPKTSTQAFMGWNVIKGASNIVSAVHNGESVSTPYQNGTIITIKGDVTLSVNAPYGHWLVFDENGKGATYNAPQFIEDGDTTSAPSLEMMRLGYTFGGWYKDQSCTDGNEFTFGNELEDNTTIYAKWTPAQTANYTVIVWKERMADTYAENGGTGEGKQKYYDFAESYTFTGNVGTNASAVSNGTTSVVDGDDNGTQYYNARIRGRDVNNTNIDKTVSYTGYHCAGYDTEVEITPEGKTVVNVYYDRNTVTYTFYTYGNGTSSKWYLCTEDGTVLYEDGDRTPRYFSNIGIYNGSNFERYSNSIVRHGDGRNYYYSTSSACSGETIREAHWEERASSGSQWNVYQKSTGLYGESLDWPIDTNIWWYEDHNTTSGTGTRMTYKDAFLPLDNDMTVEYWGNTASASGRIHFWTQDVEGGDAYTDQVQVATGNANFSINNKFTGFYAYQYRIDNGQWTNVGGLNENTGIYGSPVSYQDRLDIRYNRIKAAITFMDGAYFDGNGNPIDETPQAEEFYTSPEYYYEADVRSYNKNGVNYYTPPEKEGYTFAGWYADDACTVAYDFNTMPVTGITVYAKWIQNQYRVFLHPNVPESDTTLDWGSEDQDMNFRVSSGSKVSTPTGTRTGYKFIGWYFDEACTQVFDGDRYVLNDTTVTTPYDKTVDMTDEMNKYGNIIGTGTNADMTGYEGGERFWITRKLDLYAKWREELIGADGIGVRYDANGGSNAPADTTLYLDNTDTVAQGASNPPDETQQFLHWVLQTWDETAGKYVDLPGEDNIIYPGGTFTVLKANAQVEELEGSTEEEPRYRYTVQLRAEYGPKDEPTPTHLTWYANGGISQDETTEQYTDPKLQINEAVPIHPAETFKREGYAFIGWARVDSTTEGYTLSPRDLTEDDLFLKYEEGKFYAQITDGSDEWTEVTQVAADEKTPYHDLYAVWEKKKYTVKVIKSVSGMPGDEEIPFTFTPVFEGLIGSEYTSAFQLVGKAGGADIETGGEMIHYDQTKDFMDVPYGTTFSITELSDDAFGVIATYTVTGADKPEDNKTVVNVTNGTPITLKGNTTLTVYNTRKVQAVRIKKTELDGSTPLGNAVFTVDVSGTDYTLTSDADGFLKNETFSDGILMIPYGTYTIKESTPPTGYLPLPSDVSLRVDSQGVTAASFRVIGPTETENYYTVIIPNNPGVSLPNTGGNGVYILYILGTCLMMVAGALLIKRRV